jgi:hypothetical protein
MHRGVIRDRDVGGVTASRGASYRRARPAAALALAPARQTTWRRLRSTPAEVARRDRVPGAPPAAAERHCTAQLSIRAPAGRPRSRPGPPNPPGGCAQRLRLATARRRRRRCRLGGLGSRTAVDNIVLRLGSMVSDHQSRARKHLVARTRPNRSDRLHTSGRRPGDHTSAAILFCGGRLRRDQSKSSGAGRRRRDVACQERI